MSTPEVDPLGVDTSLNQSQPIAVVAATPEVDPLAADKAAIVAAQALLAADQAAHDQKQAALDAATQAHADAHTALEADQKVLEAAQAKLAQDQAQLEADKQAHAQAVADLAAMPSPQPGVLGEVEQHLHAMEDTAIRWGGDIGTELRTVVGKLKSLFGIAPRS